MDNSLYSFGTKSKNDPSKSSILDFMKSRISQNPLKFTKSQPIDQKVEITEKDRKDVPIMKVLEEGADLDYSSSELASNEEEKDRIRQRKKFSKQPSFGNKEDVAGLTKYENLDHRKSDHDQSNTSIMALKKAYFNNHDDEESSEESYNDGSEEAEESEYEYSDQYEEDEGDDEKYFIKPFRKNHSFEPKRVRINSYNSPELKHRDFFFRELEGMKINEVPRFNSNGSMKLAADKKSHHKSKRKRTYSNPDEEKQKILQEQEENFKIELEKIEREKCIADPDRKHMLQEANIFLKKVTIGQNQNNKENNDAALSNADEDPQNYIIDWKQAIDHRSEYLLKDKGIFKSRRVVFAQKGGYPTIMTSLIMPKAVRDYDVKMNQFRRMKELMIDSSSSSDQDLFSQTDSDYFGSSDSEGDKFDLPLQIYDFEPLFLEDSKIGRAYVINLSAYRISMNPYVSSQKLDEDLDRNWRKKYPHITGISLPKIREEKYSVCEHFLQGEGFRLPLIILTRSWVCFERLVLRNVVNESECKNILATCIMMNYKFFLDYGESQERQKNLEKLHICIGAYTDIFGYKKTLFKNELKVLKGLNYSLSCADNCLTSHVKSFLTMLDMTFKEYEDECQIESSE
ncbi:unnamed protein product [Moneuplotes crassus]|uniref:Uncharacterized protein n=1 Tax=Euplotes crassus TaxID=5936 RepID=A0AAD1U4E5_EUPCR|nr:unnamed protein product [Moneuplotes crassus]